MKKSAIIYTTIVLFLALIIIYGFEYDAHDYIRYDIMSINNKLKKTDNNFPDFIKLINDEYNDGINPVFLSEINKSKFLKKVDVREIDLKCGRMFLIQEKSLLGGYRRSFILHKDITDYYPITID